MNRVLATSLCAIALVLPALSSAQFKVVSPDGTVTYTDRQPVDSGLKVQPLRRDAASSSSVTAAPELPYMLRQAVTRYPATLYTAPSCAACDTARSALRARGIPYTERVAADDEGVRELRRLEQTSEVPVLRLGRQQMVGYAADDWQAMLDAAGYPRTSVLPANWRVPAPEPLAAPRSAEVTPARAPAPTTSIAPVSPTPPANPAAGGIRF